MVRVCDHAREQFQARYGAKLEGPLLEHVSRQLTRGKRKTGRGRCLVQIGRLMVPLVYDRRYRIIITALPPHAAANYLVGRFSQYEN